MKSSQCSICNSPRRLDIEREYIQGKTMTSIARKYNTHPVAIKNHCQNHLSRQLVQAYEKKEIDVSSNLIAEIDEIIKKTKSIFDRNYEKKRDMVALKALSEQRNTLELLSRISYALHQAKALEYEQDRMERDTQRNTQDIFNLQVLTLPELEMLQKLQNKLMKQDATIIIIPESNAKPMRRKRFSSKPVDAELITE